MEGIRCLLSHQEIIPVGTEYKGFPRYAVHRYTQTVTAGIAFIAYKHIESNRPRDAAQVHRELLIEGGWVNAVHLVAPPDLTHLSDIETILINDRIGIKFGDRRTTGRYGILRCNAFTGSLIKAYKIITPIFIIMVRV